MSEKPAAFLYDVEGWSHREVRLRRHDPLPKGWAETPLFAGTARDFETGRFSEWSTRDLAGQCRMQARENLDPEYSQFMMALAERLASLS